VSNVQLASAAVRVGRRFARSGWERRASGDGRAASRWGGRGGRSPSRSACDLPPAESRCRCNPQGDPRQGMDTSAAPPPRSVPATWPDTGTVPPRNDCSARRGSALSAPAPWPWSRGRALTMTSSRAPRQFAAAASRPAAPGAVRAAIFHPPAHEAEGGGSPRRARLRARRGRPGRRATSKSPTVAKGSRMACVSPPGWVPTRVAARFDAPRRGSIYPQRPTGIGVQPGSHTAQAPVRCRSPQLRWRAEGWSAAAATSSSTVDLAVDEYDRHGAAAWASGGGGRAVGVRQRLRSQSPAVDTFRVSRPPGPSPRCALKACAAEAAYGRGQQQPPATGPRPNRGATALSEIRRATSTGGHSAEASTLNNDATGSRTVMTRSPGAKCTYLLHFPSRKRVTYPPYDTPIVRVCAPLPPSSPTPFPCARIAT